MQIAQMNGFNVQIMNGSVGGGPESSRLSRTATTRTNAATGHAHVHATVHSQE